MAQGLSVKLDSFLKPFRGRGDNFQTFWSKFLVLADANGWDTGEKKMAKLPLLLDGAAYTVVDQLSADDKKDPAKVKEALETAFSPSPAEAYHLFVARRLLLDEPVDAYVADLRRLLELSKHAISGDGKDPVLIEQFLSGLPTEVGKTLRLAHAADPHTISQLVSKARTMQSSGGVERAAAAISPSVLCYHCNQVGHLQRNCPRRGGGATGNSGGGGGGDRDRRSGPRCFKCNQLGHIRRNCPKAKKGTSGGGGGKSSTAAAAVSSQDRTGTCLALVKSSSDLVRVAVEVQPKRDASSDCGQDEWTRFASVLDTGCTKSLMELALVEQLGLVHAVQQTEESLVSIDGKRLHIHGSVVVLIRRLDGPVNLPTIEASFLVVDNLDALNADLLIGSDIVAQVGGVSIGYDGPGGALSSVTFGPVNKPQVAAASVQSPGKKLSRHISVAESSNGVELSMTDIKATWNAVDGHWQAEWTWKDGIPPTSPLGSGIGEYPRTKLTDQEESLFENEVQTWLENEWLVPYDAESFGDALCVLPLIAVSQPHKSSTPVRPCLDYRQLNEHLVSHPGYENSSCDETIRSWRMRPEDSVILDLRKAYLQIHVAPSLYRYQAVLWRGRLYAMTRMGFGLNVAPKIMDMVVKWVTNDLPGVDNYVDDLCVPKVQLTATTAQLKRYGLDTKPPADMVTAPVLGLQLSSNEGMVQWTRRDGMALTLPDDPTRRQVVSWCGKLVGHYPVCNWLRPACNWVKRQVSSLRWEEAAPAPVVQQCQELAERLQASDPVGGIWSVPSDDATVWDMWCDASTIAMGAVVQANGVT